jgi:hypothetical protein
MSTNETKTTAKTETPSNPFTGAFPSFDPTGAWAQGQQAFNKLLADSVARWQSFADQFASVEQQVTSHAQTAVAQWAQLAKDAIAYSAQLSSEARRISAETAKKMGVQA